MLILDEPRPGAASRVAAGMLAPSAERLTGQAKEFAVAARERFPSYLTWIEQRTGVLVPLNRLGILSLPGSERTAEETRKLVASGDTWLDAEELAKLEPSLAGRAGAVFHPLDGAVDNAVLVGALQSLAAADRRISRVSTAVVSLELSRGASVRTNQGSLWTGGAVVLAAGAWSAQLSGLPRPLPVEPIRGQLVALEGAPLRHVTFTERGYLVPRGGERTIVGSTMERVGFDTATTESAIASLWHLGATVVPALRHARVLETSAGLRPVTPDLLPILGRDPDRGALIYACGHSRNGVLMGPLTGDCLSALIAGEKPPADLTPFAMERFERAAPIGVPVSRRE